MVLARPNGAGRELRTARKLRSGAGECRRRCQGVSASTRSRSRPGLATAKASVGRAPSGARGPVIVAEPLPTILAIFVLSFGSGFRRICIQQGLVLLHASAVAIGGGAVVFAGPSGIGKSTLLGAFVATGHTAIADDLSLIESGAAGPAHVRAAPGYLRLWRIRFGRWVLLIGPQARSFLGRQNCSYR